MMGGIRQKLEAALAKPFQDIEAEEPIHPGVFSPWDDIIEGIDGNYSSESDDLMIEALKAVRDHQTFEFIDRRGFAGEFMLYVLSGHGLLDCGTSPRGGWPAAEIADLWQPLIDKWEGYCKVYWER